MEASGVVNDDILPDFGAIAFFKRIVYWSALRLLFDCVGTRLAVRSPVQDPQDKKWYKTSAPEILSSGCNVGVTQAHMDRKKPFSGFRLLRMRLGLQALRRTHGQFL